MSEIVIIGLLKNVTSNLLTLIFACLFHFLVNITAEVFEPFFILRSENNKRLQVERESSSTIPDIALGIKEEEHGPDSQVGILTTGDGVYVEAIKKAINLKYQSLPKGDFSSKAFSIGSLCS